MTEMTLIDGLRQGMDEELERDERVFIVGEDVGPRGGVFRATQGLMASSGWPFTTPVSTGFMAPVSTPPRRNARTSAHATTVFPTPVSVPVTKKPRATPRACERELTRAPRYPGPVQLT